MNRRRLSRLLVLTALFGLPAALPTAQSGADFREAIAQFPDLGPILNAPPAITSTLGDVPTVIGLPAADDYPVNARPMAGRPRRADGVFTLAPGAWEMQAELFLLQPGTIGHEAGEGYVVARLAGPRAEIIRGVLQRAFQQPDIRREDVQAVLWGIVSRATLSQAAIVRAAAARLITPQESREIEAARLAVIPPAVRAKLDELLPDVTADIVVAEAEIRELLQAPEVTFDRLERAAVPNTRLKPVLGDRDLLEGRWSSFDRVLVRPAPVDGRTVKLQVIVPEGRVPQVTRDAAGRVSGVRYGSGLQITAEYDDSIPPLKLDADPGVTAYRFRRIVVAGGARNAEIAGTGWTFVGNPRGVAGDVPETGAAEVLPGFRDRHQALMWWSRNGELTHVPRQPGVAAVGSFVDEFSFRAGVRAALAARGQMDAVIDTLDLVSFEWLYCRIATAPCAVEGAAGERPSVPFDPTALIVLPGNRGRQPLVTSGRGR